MDAFLKALPFFQTVTDADSDVGRSFVRRRFDRGAVVFNEGDPPRAAFLLRAGLVKIAKHSPSHRTLAVEIVTPGEMFGAVAVLDRRPFPASAVALDACELFELPADVFDRLLSKNAGFARAVHAAVGAHVRNAQEMRSLAGEPVERRIAHVLLRLLPGERSTAPLRREDVAELAGCIPETAIRVLSDFARRGWIDKGRRRIDLRNRRALQQVAQTSAAANLS
jgi:CRP-like cAMP-binding protein